MPPVKRRYILFKIDPLSEESHETGDKKKPQQPFLVHEGEIVNVVRQTVKQVHGDFGLASILFNFHLKKYDSVTRTGVLVVKRASYMFLLTTLPLIKMIRDRLVRVTTLKLTGTLRGSLRALQGYHGKMIHEYKKQRQNNRATTSSQSSSSFIHIESVEQIDQGFQSIAECLKKP